MSCPLQAHAQASAHESELDDWRLLQFSNVVDGALGKLFATKDAAPHRYRAYQIGKDAYMVFGIHEAQPQVMASVQLTGTAAADMLPFKWLKLGDSRESVIAALGEPISLTQSEEPKVSWLKYDNRNYPVEVDGDSRLYGIRIGRSDGFMVAGDDGEQDWEAFVAAVKARDPGRLLDRLRPGMEVYRDGQILAIRRRYSGFSLAPDAAFLDTFFSSTSGVSRYLDACQVEKYVRVTEAIGVGHAYKFDEKCPLAEVVLFPYAGRYRVYEVAFRATRRGFAGR